MGKSLNDNPFNSLGGFNINGIGISQEAIEENKKALGQIEDTEEQKTYTSDEVDAIINKGKPKKEDINDFISTTIKENMAKIKNVSDEERTLIKDLLKEDDTLVNEDKLKDKLYQIQKEEEQRNKQKKYEEIQEQISQHKNDIADKLKNKYVSDMTTKERTTKKTYIIKDEYIEIIEGLAILKQEQIKDIVNEVIKRGLNSIEEKHEGILDKAKKSYKNKDKKDKDIF